MEGNSASTRTISSGLASAAARLAIIAAFVLAGSSAAAWPPCDDFVWAEVENGTVTVHHDGAFYNCCTDGFDYEVSLAGAVIRITETEILTNPCYCLCCMDNFVDIDDVAPGEYTIVFAWYDYETDAWVEWSLGIVVPDAGQSGGAALASSGTSGCYDPTGASGGEAERATWGSVKARYHD